MNKQILNHLSIIFNSLLFLLSIFSCAKKELPTQDSHAKYGVAVAEFCNLVVSCQRQELQKVLADDIQRRTYLESKMTDQACVNTQLISIEKNTLLYKSFQECNQALQLIQSTNCEMKIQTLKQNHHCKTALQIL